MADVVTTIPCLVEGCSETLHIVIGPLELDDDDSEVYCPLILAEPSRDHLRAH